MVLTSAVYGYRLLSHSSRVCCTGRRQALQTVCNQSAYIAQLCLSCCSILNSVKMTSQKLPLNAQLFRHPIKTH